MRSLRNRSLLSVNEDFEGKRNAEVHFLFSSYFSSSSFSLALSFPVAGAPGTAMPSEVLGDLKEDETKDCIDFGGGAYLPLGSKSAGLLCQHLRCVARAGEDQQGGDLPHGRPLGRQGGVE